MIWKSVLLVLRKQECLWLLKTKCNYDHIQQGPFGTNYLLNIKGLEFDSQKETMCLKKFFCLGAFQSLETVGEMAKFLSINWGESVDEECHFSLRSMTRTSAASPIFCALNRNQGSCHFTGEQPLTSSWPPLCWIAHRWGARNGAGTFADWWLWLHRAAGWGDPRAGAQMRMENLT